MIAQCERGRQESFKRRLFNRFGGGALVAWIQVIIEKRAEVDFVEWISRRWRFLGSRRGCVEGLWSLHAVDYKFQRPVRLDRDFTWHLGRQPIRNGFTHAICTVQNLLVGRLIHPIGLELRQHFLGGNFVSAVFGGFFQDRIVDDLLVDHLLQFQTVQLQHRHHLDQAWREDLLLRDLQLESWRKQAHCCLL